QPQRKASGVVGAHDCVPLCSVRQADVPDGEGRHRRAPVHSRACGRPAHANGGVPVPPNEGFSPAPGAESLERGVSPQTEVLSVAPAAAVCPGSQEIQEGVTTMQRRHGLSPEITSTALGGAGVLAAVLALLLPLVLVGAPAATAGGPYKAHVNKKLADAIS